MSKLQSESKHILIDVLHGELTQCRSDITSYNMQFITSAVLCSVLAAFAAVLCTSAEDSQMWNLFYLLPTIYFFSLYNLIKYTGEQLKLKAYRFYLENLLNQCFNESVMLWEKSINHGASYVFFGAVVQIFFIIPISLVLLWGFTRIEKNWLWIVICACMVFQVIIITMAVDLCFIKKASLRHLGYELNGSLGSIEIKRRKGFPLRFIDMRKTKPGKRVKTNNLNKGI